MKKTMLFCLFLGTLGVAWGQNERKVIRQGVRAYQDGDYSEAEVHFRKAGDMNQESFEAEFNTGAALYGQEKYEETVKQYETLVDQTEDLESMAHIYHNMGNSLLEAQKYKESIEAYKNSLKLNPGDQDTKYNLAYAKQKLQEQQQQEQENQDQQDQENQDQENQNRHLQNHGAESVHRCLISCCVKGRESHPFLGFISIRRCRDRRPGVPSSIMALPRCPYPGPALQRQPPAGDLRRR